MATLECSSGLGVRVHTCDLFSGSCSSGRLAVDFVETVTWRVSVRWLLFSSGTFDNQHLLIDGLAVHGFDGFIAVVLVVEVLCS